MSSHYEYSDPECMLIFQYVGSHSWNKKNNKKKIKIFSLILTAPMSACKITVLSKWVISNLSFCSGMEKQEKGELEMEITGNNNLVIESQQHF